VELMAAHMKKSVNPLGFQSQSGFTLTEFLIAATVFLVISSSIFSMLFELQNAGSYQAEVQSVLGNTHNAMLTVERYIRQAGNDPLGIGVTGITIVSAEEIQVRSDITGSAGPANPDKGDPDGDVEDSGESVVIRYNSRTRSLEIVPEGGTAQIVAGFITGLAFQFYDANGNLTSTSRDVRRVGITMSAAGLQPDQRTGKVFGMQIKSEIEIIA
jgi:prepilin-type N-terminal cleavage/methylation domain-containing protein